MDTQAADGTGEWNWRGKGWLMIAASHWEVLGWGGGAAAGGEESAKIKKGEWAVTYFAKTLFTPAGIDVYSRDEGGLGEEMVEHIKEALAKSEDDAVKKLADTLFEVKIG